MNAHAETEAVEQRHRGEHLVAGAEHRVSGDYLLAERVEVEVGEQDALGGAGGAAGIKDCAAIIGLAGVLGQGHVLAGAGQIRPEGIALLGQLGNLPGSLGHGVQHTQGEGQLVGDLGNNDLAVVIQLGQDFRHLPVELIQGQHGLGMGHIQVKSNFLGSGQGMDHVGDGSDAVQGIEAVQGLGGVGHTNGHPVALADAQLHQALGGPVDTLDKFFIGGSLAHKGIGQGLGIFLSGLRHHLIHGQTGIVQRGRCIAVVSPPGGGQCDSHSFFLYPFFAVPRTAWVIFLPIITGCAGNFHP